MTPTNEQAADACAELMAAWDAQLADGGRPSTSDSAEAAPELQPLLEEGLDILRRLNHLRGSNGSQPKVANRTSAVQPGQRFGRFLVRSELGRGGFATVFLAFDPRLGRDVAVKVPHAGSLMTPELRERFQNESQAAASLDHPNIVSVYEADEIGPISFIVSAYCTGGNLAQWLHARTESVPVALAADWIRQIALGVHHAHEHGIVHRDLKPANVLLHKASADGANNLARHGRNQISDSVSSPSPPALRGRGRGEGEFAASPPSPRPHPPVKAPGGEGEDSTKSVNQLQPKIADFGLAKPVDSECGLTRSGTVVGTPNYMAPEQAVGRAKAVGPAADVYALGAVLYELLTGRPPFVAESMVETLQLIRFEEPIPPHRLRTGLPHDLETICLKCLQKEPARRYASAAALAEDLRCFSAGESIHARPVGMSEKTVRWALRNPATAALVIALLMTLAGGFAGVFWQWRRADDLAVKNGIARDEAAVLATTNGTERDKAVKNYQRARAAVEQLAKLGNEIANRPGLDRTRQAIAEDVLNNCLGFLTESNDDPAIRVETADAWYQVGRLRSTFGKYDTATAAFAQAMTLYEQILADEPRAPRQIDRYAQCIMAQATARRMAQDWPGAVAGYEKAIGIYVRLTEEFPSTNWMQLRHANCLMNWASLRRQFSLDDAEEAINQVLAIHQRVAEKEPDNQLCIQDSALAFHDRSLIMKQRGLYGQAEVDNAASLRRCQRLMETAPTNQDYWSYAARAHRLDAEVFRATRRPARAEESCREALILLRKILADHPEYAVTRADLVDALSQLNLALNAQARPYEAIAELKEAVNMQRDIVRNIPYVETHLTTALNLELRLAGALTMQDRCAEAVSYYRDILDAQPKNTTALSGLARMLALGVPTAQRNPVQAIKLAVTAVSLVPKSGEYWISLSAAFYSAGLYRLADFAVNASVHYPSDSHALDWVLMGMCNAKMNVPIDAAMHLDNTKQWRDQHPEVIDLFVRRLHAEALAAGMR